MAQFIQFGNRRIQKRVESGLWRLALVLCVYAAFATQFFGFSRQEASAQSAPFVTDCVGDMGAIPTVCIDNNSDALPAAAQGGAALVMECATGRVLYQRNAHAPMPMASTTKILTAITAIRHLDVNKVVTVCRQAAGVEGSSIYLKAGEKWRVLDLLYGLMLRSGNDAATQLAISAAGSVEAFAALMNDTAVAAGAYRSHFVNPHGLHDDRHYTTAYDLACITAYALRDALFSRIVATKNYRFTMPSGEVRTFVNKNKMLSGYEGANGVKTGYTKVAGRCLVSSARRNGMQLVSVVLNEYDMWYRSADLLDDAFAAYRMRPVWTAGELRTARYRNQPTPLTVRQTYLYPLTDEEYDRLKYVFSLSGKDSRDAQLGEVFVYLDSHVVMRAPVFRGLSAESACASFPSACV